MILVHLIIGIILGKLTGNYFPFILGSILPDLDHLYIIIKNKLFTINKIINTIKYEERYNIKYKTPFFHSIFGLIIFSLIFYFISNNYILTIYFASAYLLHLAIDWLDIDKKYFLYPLKMEFKGFLPIWSKTEKIITLILIIILTLLFIVSQTL